MSFLDKEGLRYFWQGVKKKFYNKSEIDSQREELQKGIEDATKTGGVEAGTIVYIEDDAEVPEGYELVEDDYSEEKLTGEYWINGKPLYRKVIQLTTPTTDTNGTIAWTEPKQILENIDFVILKNSFVVKPTVDGTATFDTVIQTPFHNGTSIVLPVLRKMSSNKVMAVLGNGLASYSNMPIYLVCEYTKTTD